MWEVAVRARVRHRARVHRRAACRHALRSFCRHLPPSVSPHKPERGLGTTTVLERVLEELLVSVLAVGAGCRDQNPLRVKKRGGQA